VGVALRPGRPAEHFDATTRTDEDAPGLVADKLKTLLAFIATQLQAQRGHCRVVFAYDEAQNLSDNSGKEQFPLSTLLDVFQYLQRTGVPFMLVLTGLPTMFPKLVEARTYSERLFSIVTLGKLVRADSREAITKPLDTAGCPIRFDDHSVEDICDDDAGDVLDSGHQVNERLVVVGLQHDVVAVKKPVTPRVTPCSRRLTCSTHRNSNRLRHSSRQYSGFTVKAVER
jgi:hypothetical protein